MVSRFNIKHLKYYLAILVTFINSNSAIAQDWSNFMGRMNWLSADAKCKSIGMRLPTVDELEKDFKLDKLKSWENSGQFEAPFCYWSGEFGGMDDSYKKYKGYNVLSGGQCNRVVYRRHYTRCHR